MSKLLGLLSVLAASALVAAQDSGTPIDFYTEVLYAPPSAWHSSLNDPCGAIDHYTTDPNAYLQVNFTGMFHTRGSACGARTETSDH